MFENTVAVAGGVGRTDAAAEVAAGVVADGALLVVLAVLPVVLDEFGELALVCVAVAELVCVAASVL